MLETQTGVVTLSPAYDLLCTRAYGDPLMALPLGGKQDELTRTDFTVAAAAFSVPERAITSRLDAMATAGEAAIAAMPVFDLPAPRSALREEITRRLRSLRTP